MSFLNALRGKQPEIKILDLIEQHQSLSVKTANFLLQAVNSKTKNQTESAHSQIKDLCTAEEEADTIRRSIENEIARGILPPLSRADMVRFTERLDRVPDWCKESGRILELFSWDKIPQEVAEGFIEMTQLTNHCVRSLAKVVKLLYTDHEKAFDSCNTVELIEHEIDNLYIEIMRRFYQSDMEPKTLILAKEFIEGLEMIGDSCEDAADLIRVLIVSTFY